MKSNCKNLFIPICLMLSGCLDFKNDEHVPAEIQKDVWEVRQSIYDGNIVSFTSFKIYTNGIYYGIDGNKDITVQVEIINKKIQFKFVGYTGRVGDSYNTLYNIALSNGSNAWKFEAHKPLSTIYIVDPKNELQEIMMTSDKLMFTVTELNNYITYYEFSFQLPEEIINKQTNKESRT